MKVPSTSGAWHGSDKPEDGRTVTSDDYAPPVIHLRYWARSLSADEVCHLYTYHRPGDPDDCGIKPCPMDEQTARARSHEPWVAGDGQPLIKS